jgi:PAS domain S-box-containing protein
MSNRLNINVDAIKKRLDSPDELLESTEERAAILSGDENERFSKAIQALQKASPALEVLVSAVEHAHDAIIVTEAGQLDLPGPRIVYVNETFTKTTGYTFDEAFGRSPRMLHGPKTDRAALDRIRKALTCGESIRIELVNYRKDGSEFNVDLSIAPMKDENGWFSHFVSIRRDVTERDYLRKRLQESEDRVRALMEAIPQPKETCNTSKRFKQ